MHINVEEQCVLEALLAVRVSDLTRHFLDVPN